MFNSYSRLVMYAVPQLKNQQNIFPTCNHNLPMRVLPLKEEKNSNSVKQQKDLLHCTPFGIL